MKKKQQHEEMKNEWTIKVACVYICVCTVLCCDTGQVGCLTSHFYHFYLCCHNFFLHFFLSRVHHSFLWSHQWINSFSLSFCFALPFALGTLSFHQSHHVYFNAMLVLWQSHLASQPASQTSNTLQYPPNRFTEINN